MADQPSADSFSLAAIIWKAWLAYPAEIKMLAKYQVFKLKLVIKVSLLEFY